MDRIASNFLLSNSRFEERSVKSNAGEKMVLSSCILRGLVRTVKLDDFRLFQMKEWSCVVEMNKRVR